MDDTFGGVIIGGTEASVIVAISNRPGQSGYSGYSGPGGGGGSGPGGSGFSGKSGYSGACGKSGFSGFSGRSAFSGYSGSGRSGFSGYSGASGASGPGGGNSGYSGYSGQDGTFSGSGFSGYSGFSSRSGFSGYSGSGISGFSAYSGFSGAGTSGFSGFSGLDNSKSGFSGFSGFSSQSGFSGFSSRSGFSGYSGTGSPSVGLVGQMQYSDGAGGFGGTPNVTVVPGQVNLTAANVYFQDSSDTTKKLRVEAGLLPTGVSSVLTMPAVNNPVAIAPTAATPNQYATGVTGAGQLTKAPVDFSNLTGLAAYGQMDRSTAVVVETATLTIAANTKIKSTASGTLTTIAFSGLPSAAQGRRLDLDVTGGPYTINIPACRRIGETGSITSLLIPAGYHEFSWEYINGEYVMSDSVADPSGGGGASGYSGYSGGGVGGGSSGFSGFSGRSGFSGAGTSGFSGFSGPGSSGFSGYSAPSILPFTTHNDTDWTLVLGDANTGVKMASASAHSVVIPPNSSVAFPIGTQIVIEQGGTSLVSISPGVGVTLQGATLTDGQYSIVVLIKQATDQWLSARSGASGFSGFSGGPGVSGFSGASGTGPSGFSGFCGAGFSGYSGYSSLSGYSGKSGYSGYSAPQLMVFSTQTDTDYTLVFGDANTGVKMSSGSPHNLIVPPNSSVAFPIGTQIAVEQGSSGVVTIQPGAGVTLQGSTVTAGQFSLVCLVKQGTDTWLISSGNSGYSGFSGKSGYSGYSAFSGFSAYSGFSGSGGWVRLSVQGADVTTGNTTLTDITGLVTPATLSPSTVYEIRATLRVATSADITGIRYGVGVGGSGAAALCNALITGTVQTNTGTTGTIDQPNSVSGVFMTTASESGTIYIRGFATTRSVLPTLSIMHGKVTSGLSTVKVGSVFEYRVADV